MELLWVRTLHEAVVGGGHYMKLLWVRTLHEAIVGEDIT